jgi:quercetin dioxygenase-like cupin family protein
MRAAAHDGRATRQGETPMQETVFDLREIEPRAVIPGFSGRFVHASTMTFAYWEIAAGAILPEHSHPHEQVVHVFEGALEVTVDGATTVLKGGMVGVVPPGAVHSGRALTDCRVMDAFHPVREDYKSADAPAILQAAMGDRR